MISAPDGKAKRDYEQWLVEHPSIAKEIDEKIHNNRDRMCGNPIEKKVEDRIMNELHITEPE